MLHDCVEDGDLDIDDLRHEFSPEVVAGVDAVTRRPDEPYADLIERAAADPVGRWVKLADKHYTACDVTFLPRPVHGSVPVWVAKPSR